MAGDLRPAAGLFPGEMMPHRVPGADLLLMDEPYGQLDVKLRYYLEDELVRLWEHLKSTVIFGFE
jgi:ABC-type sugar transport system ATPase subunit